MRFCGSHRSFESPLVDVNLKPPCESSFCLPHCCGRSSVVETFPYFWTLKLYTTALPWHELFTPTSVYGSSSRSASSSTAPPPPPLLLCPTSPPSPRTEPPAPLAPQPPETAGALQPEPADKRHQRKKLASSGSSPHDRDESLGGWEEEFEKTDKCSFIATYLKQLITYGRWCGIFSVGCLWTNSAVLCKLPIWPSLCISLTLAALRSHMLGAQGPRPAEGQGPSSLGQQKTPWSHSRQPPQTFSVNGRWRAALFSGERRSSSPPPSRLSWLPYCTAN